MLSTAILALHSEWVGYIPSLIDFHTQHTFWKPPQNEIVITQCFYLIFRRPASMGQRFLGRKLRNVYNFQPGVLILIQFVGF